MMTATSEQLLAPAFLTLCAAPYWMT